MSLAPRRSAYEIHSISLQKEQAARVRAEARGVSRGGRGHEGGSGGGVHIPAGTIHPIKMSVGSGHYTGDLGAQLNQLEKDFTWYCNQFEEGSMEVLLAALAPTIELASFYCPKKTGALAESAYLEAETFRNGQRVEMGFAKGGQPDYAIIVHEDVEATHEPPTKAKFMQDAIDEDWGNVTTRIAQGYQLMSGLK